MDESYYIDLHERIVAGAMFIEDTEQDDAQDPRLPVAHGRYDRLCAEYRAYRVRCTVQNDPSMRAEYERLGLIGKDELL